MQEVSAFNDIILFLSPDMEIYLRKVGKEIFLGFFPACISQMGLVLGSSDAMPLLMTFLKGKKLGKYPLRTPRGQFIT